MEKLGPYKLGSLLGTGGMGRVYRAVDERTGQDAAVKVLSPAYSADNHFRARFGAEIQSLRKLRHPGIVELYGYGEQDGHLFYAMELVEGSSVAEQIKSGRRFSWQEVARIGIDICAALRHAHDHGVIHRDLKPANLMLGADNLVKLTDFGIAKLFGATQLTADGGVIGTADFMAPEQAAGRPATARSDLYSLGSVMYAMLARRSPFAAGTMGEVMHGLMYEDAPPLERYAPDAPREFTRIVHRLLEKDPEQRIGTALAVSNRLSELDLGAPGEDAAAADSASHEAEEELDSKEEFDSNATEVPNSDTAVRPTVPYPSVNTGSRQDAQTHDAPTRGSTTHADAAVSSGPAAAPQPIDHFTTVEHSDRKAAGRAGDAQRPWWTNWPLIAVLLLMVAGGAAAVWQATRPESADAIIRRIRVAAAEDSSRLDEVESDIDAFLARFPDDPRREEVASYKTRLDVEKWLRQAELKAKLNHRGLSPMVQWLISARRLAETDHDLALKKLEALVALLQNAPPEDATGKGPAVAPAERQTEKHDQDSPVDERRMCLAAAQRELDRLREISAAEARAQLPLIEREMKHASELLDDDPATAAEIWRSIVELFANKRWARDQVNHAKSELKKLTDKTSEPGDAAPVQRD